jgi:putative addiction module killer protein
VTVRPAEPPARKVSSALDRLGLGNFSNGKSIAAGGQECRIHFGPGHRVWFGPEGERIVIRLGGGTKQELQADIRIAIVRWEDSKQRKTMEGK